MMNEVIDQLTQIEEQAVKITDSTGVQKAQLVQESQKREREFEEALRARTEESILEMKKENDKKIQERIGVLQQEHEKAVEWLEEQYQKKHTELAKGIVNILTGV